MRLCAKGLKCARTNQQELIQAGFNKKSAYCLNSNNDDKYYCYDPNVLKILKACPADFMNNPNSCSIGSPWFEETCLEHIDPEYQCGHAPIKVINATHATCEKFQKCYSYRDCGCDSEGYTQCASSTANFPQICV